METKPWGQAPQEARPEAVRSTAGGAGGGGREEAGGGGGGGGEGVAAGGCGRTPSVEVGMGRRRGPMGSIGCKKRRFNVVKQSLIAGIIWFE